MDPVSAIASAAGSLFGFVDSLIYSPQEQAANQAAEDNAAAKRAQAQAAVSVARYRLQGQEQLSQTLMLLGIIGTAGLLSYVVLK